MISKSAEPFTFKFHGDFDVSKIAAHVEKYSTEWFLDETRQKSFIPHKETKSVFIYDHDATWSVSDRYNLKINESQREMIDLLKPIISYLEDIHHGTIGKCLFIKLPPHKDVGEHTDKLDYLGAVRRHHIAIETNDDVLFFVNHESKNMKIGECWEINNSLPHSVKNLGKTDRIHLLLDIMPNSFIKNDIL